MKKIILSAFIAIFSIGISQAQERPAKAERAERVAKVEARAEIRRDHVKDELNLTENQGQRIKAINMNSKEEIKKIMAMDELTRDQKKARIDAIQENKQAQIEAVLDKDQKKKYKEMLERRKEHRKANAERMKNRRKMLKDRKEDIEDRQRDMRKRKVEVEIED
ncbi:hypothetical protein [Mesonia sp. K7]|uniref:hypothetical protein n=1 Tax=Mesonia sp. K7 TaxID=2218606 RepID=UPI000DA850A1|nr:hypothetical protein [Mesonia sp. K7]PZD79338.1 hypothetical protein DNG35_02295 [Mesonia sp. K7]